MFCDKISLMFLPVIVCAASVAVSGIAHAGSIGSAGGRAVVCSSDDGATITSAESLDTYEGRVAFSDRHLNAVANGSEVAVGGGRFAQLDLSDVSSIVAIAKARLANTAYTIWTGQIRFDSALDKVTQSIRLVTDSATLPTVDDSFEIVRPPAGSNCTIAQAAVFLDPETILVDARIWNAMSAFDRAALIVHETLYWLDRIEGGQVDSRYSRRAVSRLLGADWAFRGTFEDLPKEYVICNSYKGLADDWRLTMLALYPDGTKTRARIAMMNGQRSLDLTEAQVIGQFPFDFYREGNAPAADLLFISASSAWTPKTTLSMQISVEPNWAGQPERVFRISGVRQQYPAWTMSDTQLTCHSVKEPSSTRRDDQ
jgi:hypothetical protein